MKLRISVMIIFCNVISDFYYIVGENDFDPDFSPIM